MVSFSLQTVTEKFGTCLNQQAPNELCCIYMWLNEIRREIKRKVNISGRLI